MDYMAYREALSLIAHLVFVAGGVAAFCTLLSAWVTLRNL